MNLLLFVIILIIVNFGLMISVVHEAKGYITPNIILIIVALSIFTGILFPIGVLISIISIFFHLTHSDTMNKKLYEKKKT